VPAGQSGLFNGYLCEQPGYIIIITFIWQLK